METLKNRIVDIFLDLVRINATSKKEKPVADYVRQFLSALPVVILEDDAGVRVGGNTGNLIIRMEGDTNSVPLVFMAHMDTIRETAGLKPQITNGKITSDGTTILGADNRAGMAIILATLEFLSKKKNSHRNLEVVFTIGEETGLFGSANLDLNKIQSKVAYILDSSASPGSYVYAAPFAAEFEIDFIGKPSHAAVQPEQGINAMSMTNELFNRFAPGRLDDETTLNYGRICGGETNNVVPSEIHISGEIRSFNRERLDQHQSNLAQILEEIKKAYRGDYRISTNLAFPGFRLDLNSPAITALEAGYKKLHLKPEPLRYYGGSDANILNNRGIEAIDIGIGAKNPHSVDEYIHIADMEAIGKLVLHLATDYA